MPYFAEKWNGAHCQFDPLTAIAGGGRLAGDNFGTNVRTLRKLRGFSQAELAERADLSTDMLGRIERGQASSSFDTVEALARALTVSPAALFGHGDFPDEDSDRGRALRDIMSELARANDDQIALVLRLILAALHQKN